MTRPFRRPIAPQIIAIGMSLLALAAMLKPYFSDDLTRYLMNTIINMGFPISSGNVQLLFPSLTPAEINDMALPHGFSLLLRVVLSGSCAYLAFRAAEASKRNWVWILGIAAFIYNPVLPLRLGYEISFVVLAITVITLVATFWTLRT